MPNAPTLSYNVPQTVAHDGISYVEIVLRDTDWSVPTAATSAAAPTSGIHPDLRPVHLPVGGDGPPTVTSKPPVRFDIGIDTPGNGTVITATSTGAALHIIGRTATRSGNDTVGGVEITVGSNAPAGVPAGPVGWAQWSYTTPPITTSGPVTITAEVHGATSGVTASTSVTVTVTITPDPPKPDTTPPVVTLDPIPPAAADSTGTVSLTLSGTASDTDDPQHRPLTHFQLELDGAAVPDVTPDASGRWSKGVSVGGVGVHSVAVTATNAAGLVTRVERQLDVVAAPAPGPVVQRLLIAENLRVSTYLTAYGVGDPVKTVTLLPGEKTQLTISTFESHESTAQASDSILESASDTASQDFQSTVDDEQTDKSATAESKQWHVNASASAKFAAFGSVSVDGGLAGASNAAREQTAKSVVNAVNKHAAAKSSQRTATASTSREEKDTSTATTATQSEIVNTNLSCTLNVVISQLVKEYTTVLHLTDVKIAYVRGDAGTAAAGQPDAGLVWTYREVGLAQMPGLLDQVVVPDRAANVHDAIVTVLSNVFDYQGEQQVLVEERQLVGRDGKPVPNGTYLRVPPITTTVTDAGSTGSDGVQVPGVVLGVTRNVMRTASLVADVVKGTGNALDPYNSTLQQLALDQRSLSNAQAQLGVDRDHLAAKLVTEGNKDGAGLFAEVFPPTPPPTR